MPENAPDLFADTFDISVQPFGSLLKFRLTVPGPQQPPVVEDVATVRTTTATMMAMAFVVRRVVMQLREQGYSVELPTAVLNQMQISRDDWDAFWRTGGV